MGKAPGEIEQALLTDSVHFVTAWEHCVKVGPGRMHRHDAHELVCHRSGRGRVETQSGERVDFSAGSIEIVAADQRHAQHQTLTGSDCCIHFSLQQGMSKSLAAFISLPADFKPAIANDLALFLAQPPNRNRVEQRICDCRLTAVLLQLLSAAGALDVNVSPQEDACERIARRAHDFVRSHWRQIRRVEQVAGELDVSADYLRHAVRSHYGEGLHHLLTQMRITHAKELLRRSYLPQKALASICGYSDIAQFSRRFRQVTGMSPGEYRRQRVDVE